MSELKHEPSNFLTIEKLNELFDNKGPTGWKEEVIIEKDVLVYKRTKGIFTYNHIIKEPTYIWIKHPDKEGKKVNFWWTTEQEGIFNELK